VLTYCALPVAQFFGLQINSCGPPWADRRTRAALAKSAFNYAYVVSGSVSSKVNDEPEHVYKASDVFFGEPGSRHLISRNASNIKPAKLLAAFVVDSNDTALTTNDE
jgi:hypothetical protein